MKSKKGQLSLGDAPNVVLIVGMVFLVMATIAFIANKYGAAIPSDYTATSINESVTQVELAANTKLDNSSLCNAENFAIVTVYNATDTLISAGNYSLTTATGAFKNLTSSFSSGNWKVTYTTDYAGTACDVNADLETNISDNTSIAGIVLTISLVGIVLTVLIGIFVIARNRGM